MDGRRDFYTYFYFIINDEWQLLLFHYFEFSIFCTTFVVPDKKILYNYY